MELSNLRKPELLAPAGNLEKLKVAIRYGADAVYIAGAHFGLRKAAGNFSFADMKEGVEFAHSFDAKVYVAANMICHNEDLPNLKEYLLAVAETGIDAVIFADPAIYLAAKEVIPHIPLHVSTQMSTTNYETVSFWANTGVERVVLARELRIDEITEIHERVPIELECFVHGAMCVAYSGRCLLSNYMANRDANRGGCAQSCRWKYQVMNKENNNIEHNNSDEQYNKDEQYNNHGHYIMNSKDLCMVEHIPALVQAGITSFKIEGRMKSIHYVATVTNVYRQAIDAYFANPASYTVDPNWIYEIQKASHRPLSSGFYFDKPTHNEQMYKPGAKLRKYDFIGIVIDYDPITKVATIEQRNHFRVGDEVEIIGPGGIYFTQVVKQLHDEKGQPVEVAPHPLERLLLLVDQPVKPHFLMRKENI